MRRQEHPRSRRLRSVLWKDRLLEAAAYRRLLLRFIAVPVLGVCVLGIATVYGFRQVQRSARRVDHSDQVIAHANNLIKLMVDQETGLRGFLLTHQPVFLQPLTEADERLSNEFKTLQDLRRRNPEQTARLQHLQEASNAWREMARQTIAQPTSSADLVPEMLKRKKQMDAIRASADEFLNAEAAIREDRSSAAMKVDTVSLWALISLAALVGVLLVVAMYRLFGRLTRTYNLQLEEVQKRRDESFAREQWLNTTLRSIGDAVIACDPRGRVVFMNGVAEKLTGWKESEAHGLPLAEIFVIMNHRSRSRLEDPVEVVRRSGKAVGLANHTILISKDKAEFHIDDSAAPILDSKQEMAGIVLVFRDVSEKYASELALMRTEKLAAAGRLAGAIAHEVNNPLEGLVNLIYLARREENVEQVREHLTSADRELQRIAHITRQSLGFYRETSSAGLFRPDVVAREAVEFYSFRAANARIGLHLKLGTEEEAFGNAGELRQVISNLLANSLDACKAGDNICIRVHAVRSLTDERRNGVRMVVADSGSGISPENIKNIFEPFFTTKKETGTGLGLWVSRELIEKHGGTLRVRSAIGGQRSGTVFSLFLPGAAGGVV